MIKYIGSKRVLIPWLTSVVQTISESSPCYTAADLFSGTSRVGFALKEMGLDVTSNDMSSYGYTLARCLVEADSDVYTVDRLSPILHHLNALPGVDGWYAETYARRARYFTVENAQRIEAVRDEIDRVASGDALLRDILLTSLMLAADRVDSTTGVQMAYLKQYAARARTPMSLRLPPMLPGRGRALCLDATMAAGTVATDLVYLDPPYNQHSYLGNYHIWETLVRHDRPEVYGIAQKRVDTQTRKSDYNSRVRALGALRGLLDRVQGTHLLLSFSDEGYIGGADLYAAMKRWGPTVCLAQGHKRYVGAQIGIHNLKGERVGTASHARNVEYLFLATHDRAAMRAVRRAHAAEIVPGF